MRYEVVESHGEWIVHHHGVEVARFESQNLALDEIARRLRQSGPPTAPASLSMRFARRA
jgi:hypothetical protein